MINGVHAVIFTTDAERDRAFFRDVLEFPSVDAGGGWLIFALPPAELAAHPAEEGGQHELYLMCPDLDVTIAALKGKGVEVARPPRDEGFGPLTAIRLPRRRRARVVPAAAPLADLLRQVPVMTIETREEPVSDLQAIADRVEIEALRGEYNDAGAMRDFDRFALLFTEDAVMRWPHIDREFIGRKEIHAAVEQGQALWEYFVQTTHPGTIQLDGDTAVGRTYVSEFGRFLAGESHLNYAIYHDRYERAPDGWKFAERVYEILYSDTTPLAGTGRRPMHIEAHVPD